MSWTELGAQTETPGPGERAREQVGEAAEEAGEQAQDAISAFIENLPGYATTLIRIGAIIVIALFLTWLARLLVTRFERRRAGEGPVVERTEREQRAHTIGAVIRASATALIWTLAVFLIIGQLGFNLGPLLAGAGIVGVALGFGAQNMVRDHLAGFFILLEDQWSIGDIIEVAGVIGIVEKVNLRVTVLRDLDARQHIVPNGLIEVASNHSKEFSRYLMDLPVPYEADVDTAIGIFRDVVEEMRRDPEYAGVILGPLEVLGVNDFGDSQVDVRVYIETLPGRQWGTGREFRRRLKYAYDAAGISVPFPHRELILRGFSDDPGRFASGSSAGGRAPEMGRPTSSDEGGEG